MGYRTRLQYTESQKAQMWDRWQQGDMKSPLGMHRSSRRCRQHHEMPRPSMPVIAASKPASVAKRRPRSA